jgi:hypothetical protein
MKNAQTFLPGRIARGVPALVPEGHPEIARRFNAGIFHAVLQVPKGRPNQIKPVLNRFNPENEKSNRNQASINANQSESSRINPSAIKKSSAKNHLNSSKYQANPTKNASKLPLKTCNFRATFKLQLTGLSTPLWWLRANPWPLGTWRCHRKPLH